MSVLKINPDSLYDGSTTGMSQAVVDTDTGLVFISGQVDWGENDKLPGNNISEQIQRVVKNLITTLHESGSSVDHLLQLRVFVRGEVSDYMDVIVPVIAQHLGTARPALTGVGVSSLASPDLLIEIEATAKVIQDK